MPDKPLSTPVLQARDLILAACRHRINLTLTETVCRDLANNAATALIPLLEDLQRGAVVSGEIQQRDGVLASPTRARAHDEEASDQRQPDVVEGSIPSALTDDPPPVRVAVDRLWPLCSRERWCELHAGHDGSCQPPPF